MEIPESKFILDACCGGRMFWFDKNQENTVYMDNRIMPATRFSNRATLEVKPDIVADFTDMPFDDGIFALVVFDPPHLNNVGDESYMAKKYGKLDKKTWREDLRAGFAECFRVLRPQGVLIFKWNEEHISVSEVVDLSPVPPLFGNRATGKNLKTHWIVFMKL